MQRATVGQRLRQIMHDQHSKQADIIRLVKPFCTNKTKISKTDLSQYISGKTEPRLDKLSILAQGLNVSEQWLLGFNTTPVINLASTDTPLMYGEHQLTIEDKVMIQQLLQWKYSN